MKSEEIYKIFTNTLDELKRGISDLDKKFENKFESLEQKIDDRFVTKEMLAEKLKPYEEMRGNIERLVWGVVISVLGTVATIILYILQSGLIKGVKL